MLAHAFSWAVANWSNLLALAAAVVAAASVFIKALEVLVALLVTLFPGLKSTDGGLVKLAAWLDALAKSKALNAAAMSPKAKE